jgi:hypothetical protein
MSTAPVRVKPLPVGEELDLMELRLRVGVKRFMVANGGFRRLSQIYDNYQHIDRGLLELVLAKLRQEKVIVYHEGLRTYKGQPAINVWLTDINPFTGRMPVVEGEGIEAVAQPEPAPAEE